MKRNAKIILLAAAIFTGMIGSVFSPVLAAEPAGWNATISITSGSDSNTLYFGGYEDKLDGQDNSDMMARLGGRLGAYFEHADWQYGPYFWSDWRTVYLPQEWTFYVSTTYGPINMVFDTKSVPDTVKLEFIDESDGTVVDMNHRQGYGYGNVSGEPPRRFTIRASGYIDGIVTVRPDLAPPETVITGSPASYTPSTSATITYTAIDDITKAGAFLFSWSLDNGAASDWSVAESASLSGLSDGAHVFRVAAMDESGKADETPAEVFFTVDSIPPGLILDGADVIHVRPVGKRSQKTLTFTGSVSDGSNGVNSLSYSLTDEYGTASRSGFVTAGADGRFSFNVVVSTSLANDIKYGGRDTERVYTLTVTAVDMGGNIAGVTKQIVVAK